MKKFFYIFALAALMLSACSSEKPAESYIPKNTVEFAGNSFSAFSLGGDVKLYTLQNPENSSQWTLQAVVPVRKEMNSPIADLAIGLVPLDDKGVRVRDGLVLEAEDLQNLIPVYNASDNVERVIVFSIAEEDKKYMSASEAARLLENAKGVRMDFNTAAPVVQTPTPQPVETVKPAATQTSSKPKGYPMTVDGLCRKHGVYGLLSKYETELRNGNPRAAKNIEDQLWAIEKRVKKDNSIPKDVREAFVDYIEDKEDDIEDRY